MVADIRIKTSFLGHRKRKKLIKLLGAGATDYILDLWLRTALERPDGIFSGMDALDIALMAGWPGDPEKFCEDLQLAGFLEVRADRVFVLHDWAEHQPWVVGSEDRRSIARKAANIRHHGSAEGKSADHAAQGACAPAAQKMPEEGSKTTKTLHDACAPHTDGNAVSMQDACAPHTDGNAPFPSSPILKDKRHPPVLSSESTSPRGGEYAYSDAFEAWWRLYPKKVAKPYAWKCWKRIKGVGADVLIQALEQQLAVPNLGHFRTGEKVCLPDPSTWLNKGRWEDEIQTSGGGGQAFAKLKAMRGGG